MLHRRCQRRGRSQRIAMGFGALRRGCLLRLSTRRDRCDGQGRRSESVRMPSGGCQRIENGPARPEIAGLFVFGALGCRLSALGGHSMTTRLYFVRHGATELSAEDRFAGALDVALSSVGRQQAERLGARLAAEPIDVAFASPMQRTMDTARLIVAPIGIDVTPVDGIREIAHGRWEGMRRDDVERQYPEEYDRYEHDPYSFAPTDRESGLAVPA